MKLFAAFAIAILFVAVFGITSASSQTVVAITENTSEAENDPGWFFQRDPGNQTFAEFTNQKSSLGNGSIKAGPIGPLGSSKFIAEHFVFAPVGEVLTISFDFMMAGTITPTSYKQFYMNVYANFEGVPDNNFYNCKYDVVATSGSDSLFTTVMFDKSAVYPVTTRSTSPYPCPNTLAAMGPNAKIRAYSLNIGDTGTSDNDLVGYLDNVVLKRTTGTTVYNFEMSSKECKQGGWATKTGSDGLPYMNQGKCVSDTEQRRNH